MRALPVGTLLAASAAACAIQYRVVEIPAFPGYANREVIVQDVNDSGMVVGLANGQNAFTWTLEGGIRRVNPWHQTGFSDAHGISDNGNVAGWFAVIGSGTSSAFAKQDGGPLRWVWTGKTGIRLRAYDVNDSLWFTGRYYTAEGPERGFVWSPEHGFEDIGDLLPGSQVLPLAVNEAGQVAGWANALPARHAFRWSRETGMVDLGTKPGYDVSEGHDINDAGDVVVKVGQLGLRTRTFIVPQKGAWIDIGQFPNGAGISGKGINDSRTVVGNSFSGPNVQVAFIAVGGADPVDLNTLLEPGSQGWALDVATEVNNNLWVIGEGEHEGRRKAFVAIPVD